MTGSLVSPLIVWFRDDLRLSDHPALYAAASSGAPLLCLYVLDEESGSLRSPRGRPIGSASRWWLAQSLRSLQASLTARTQTLVLRQGPAANVVAGLAREIQASAVHWIESDIANQAAVERGVSAALEEIGVAARTFPSDLLVKPTSLRSKEGRGLRVFTPFWKRVLSLGDPPQPLPAPKTLKAGPKVPSDDLASWRLEPTRPDWAAGLRDTWAPGETAAQERLKDFLDGDIADYASLRDRPDRDGTSRLSPHLRFGEISPRQV